MSADLDSIKKGIADKRRRLQELRKKRQRREAEKKQRAAAAAAIGGSGPPPQEHHPENRRPGPSQSGSPPFSTTSASENPEDILASVNELIGAPSSSSGPNDATDSSANATTEITSPATSANLSISEPKHISIESRSVSVATVQVETYEQEIQVDLLTSKEHDRLIAELKEAERLLEEEKGKEVARVIELSEMKASLEAEKKKYQMLNEDAELAAKPLSKVEVDEIISGEQFQTFFSRASLMMERALSNNYDPTVDYGCDTMADGKHSEEDTALRRVMLLHDSHHTQNRAVTSLDWCPEYPELFLASYGGHEDSMSLEPDGTVLVWNTHLSTRPEFYFYCQSTVLSAQFHPVNSKLIIGGTKNGQVVVWDTRAKSSPVNRTSLSNGHINALYQVCLPAHSNALHTIYSLSTDGKFCTWADDNLHEPAAEFFLQDRKQQKTEITSTCFDFATRENSLCLVGTDEGYVYKASLSMASTKASSSGRRTYSDRHKAHEAPITNITFHPSPAKAPSHIADLYLTSSYDWTVKLWSRRCQNSLYTFESARDYVFDVQWSPAHVSTFATGDGTGQINLWDINKETEVPEHSIQLADDDNKYASTSAVSKLAYSGDGHHLLAGSSSGKLHLFSIREDSRASQDEEAIGFYDSIHKQTVNISTL